MSGGRLPVGTLKRGVPEVPCFHLIFYKGLWGITAGFIGHPRKAVKERWHFIFYQFLSPGPPPFQLKDRIYLPSARWKVPQQILPKAGRGNPALRYPAVSSD